MVKGSFNKVSKKNIQKKKSIIINPLNTLREKLKKDGTLYNGQYKTIINDIRESNNKILSKGQKKRLVKKEKVLRKKNFVAYLDLLKEEEQKKKVYGAFADFSQMTETLNTISTEVDSNLPKKNNIHKVTHKKRWQISKSEYSRYQDILNYNKFKEEPLDSINKHLVNTMK